jgi:hypothetical protein
MRTTLDLDSTVLEQLKQRQKREGRTLGQVASELLARALADPAEQPAPPDLAWVTASMGARVDLGDKDAVATALDANR